MATTGMLAGFIRYTRIRPVPVLLLHGKKKRRERRASAPPRCCVPHCDHTSRAYMDCNHPVCRECMWGCIQPRCEDGLPNYTCPMCRNTAIVPFPAFADMMANSCPEHFCGKKKKSTKQKTIYIYTCEYKYNRYVMYSAHRLAK